MLSDTQIKAAKPNAKPYTLTDGHGLFLFVTEKGGKLWRYKFRYAGKQVVMSFGKYPELSLAKAREAHLDARTKLAQGINPMEVKKQAKKALLEDDTESFNSIYKLWVPHWSIGKSPRHVVYTERRFELDVLPFIGSRNINSIEPLDVVQMIKRIEARGANDMAKRVLESTGQVFRYAVAHGLCRRNPCADIKPRDILPAFQRKNYARVEEKNLPALLRAIENYSGTPLTRLAMKLMSLVFVRTSELIEAPWSEFDFERRRWDIPAARMKMKVPHIVYLSDQTMEILLQLRELNPDSEFLFPAGKTAGKKTKTMSNNTILKALERMGYKGEMTGHGFRGVASTILNEQGYPEQHIELQLAHVPGNAVKAAYDHSKHLAARAKMMQDWADYLDRAKRGNVVALKIA